MSWDKLDIHLENLIPRVVLLSTLLMVGRFPLGSLAGHEAILATAFIGTSYMLGSVGNVLARLLLDFVCRHTLRAPMFRLFVGERLELGPKPSSREISRRFSAVITAGLSCGNVRVESEVAKRRQTCRLLRSALIPTWLALLGLGQQMHWSAAQMGVSFPLAYLLLLILYAYAEVVIFQEGYRGEQIKKSTPRRVAEDAIA